MYLEKKGKYNYLIKKVGTKKIGVNIGNDEKIDLNHINLLTTKEFKIINISTSYNNFKNQLFNKNLLDEVFFNSLFLSNQINNNLFNSDINKLFDNFPIKFIYESNKTEGSKIPFDAVEKIIKEKKYNYKIKNEIKEVENSIKVWHFMNSKFIFNVANIKKLYHLLTKSLIQENGTKYPRGFKKIPNIVNQSTTSSPENIETDIKNLIGDYKSNSKTDNPIKLAFDFHLKYEQIHPFENGNGRTGRFLLNKILLANGLLPMIVFEANRQAYFNSIASAKHGDKKKYYKFMIEQYSKSIDEYWMNVNI